MTRQQHTTRIQSVNLDDLENELKNVVRSPSVELIPAAIETPDIAKMSADAVLELYRMAAKSVEEMGEEIQKRIRALEAALKECADDMTLLKEAGQAIMEKGKLAQAEIERTTAVSKDIREIVAAIKTKLS